MQLRYEDQPVNVVLEKTEIYTKDINKLCLAAKQRLLQAIVLLLRLFTEASSVTKYISNI